SPQMITTPSAPAMATRATVTNPSKLRGAQVKRKEDPRMITGTSTYVTDVALPGMLWVAFVRSPHAHARIGTIDTSAALKIPGVKRVFTGDDLVRLAKPIPPPMAGAEGGGASDAVGRQHVALST